MRWRGRCAVAMLALAVGLGATGCVVSVGSSGAAVVDVRSLPAEVGEHYRFVAQHIALAEQVACYCGCGQTLQHRSLRDCFVRDDGRFDAHAKGCGVCLAEAAEVRRMDAEQMAPSSIAAAIDGQFGGAGIPTSNRAGGAR